MKTEYQAHLDASVAYIQSKISVRPRVAVVLGSGLGNFGNVLVDKTSIDTKDIPYYPRSSVQGHVGKLILGRIRSPGKSSGDLLVFQGRVHFYESGNLQSALYPVAVAHGLGIKELILTNAAGGVNRNLKAGDLMLITDQINLTFESPSSLVGGRHVTQQAYDSELQDTIRKVAEEKNIPLKEGVYVGVKGPSYESAAEIEMIRRIGGDAVGMSTVNESSYASASGMKVAGISCITNLATGITKEKLSHSEVTEVANRIKSIFAELISSVIQSLG